jgi:hypothetical protein
VAQEDNQWWMVYEYRANVILRRSKDGIQWSAAEEIPLTGIWQEWLMPCQPHERIGQHPYVAPYYDCLVGSPPGLFVEDGQLYVFVGMGQNPGSMGCYVGSANRPASQLRKCRNNPLFIGVAGYGPLRSSGANTNPHFDFRTVSSADVLKIDDRYYMLYEGVRGPDEGAAGDTQFALGLARSTTNQIDGPWERYSDNPILVDQPGNVGVGHADIVLRNGQTLLYTSLDGSVRSLLLLVWKQ